MNEVREANLDLESELTEKRNYSRNTRISHIITGRAEHLSIDAEKC